MLPLSLTLSPQSSLSARRCLRGSVPGDAEKEEEEEEEEEDCTTAACCACSSSCAARTASCKVWLPLPLSGVVFAFNGELKFKFKFVQRQSVVSARTRLREGGARCCSAALRHSSGHALVSSTAGITARTRSIPCAAAVAAQSIGEPPPPALADSEDEKCSPPPLRVRRSFPEASSSRAQRSALAVAFCAAGKPLSLLLVVALLALVVVLLALAQTLPKRRSASIWPLHPARRKRVDFTS